MPVNYRIEGNVVIARPMGAHGSDELRDTWLEVERDAAYPPPPAMPRVCVGVRESESIARRSVADLRDTTTWFIERTGRMGRVCALVARPGVQYGLARMISVWLELNQYEVCVSTDLDQAV